MEQFIKKFIILNKDECKIISNYILTNEDRIKELGDDIYGGTPENSLTGRFHCFNCLNVPEIREILKPKLKNSFDELKLKEPIYVQCWANTFRKGDYIQPHRHSSRGDNFICANIFLQGCLNPGTSYLGDDNYFIDVENSEGEITFFKSTLVHGVREYQNDNVRITLAMDIHHSESDSYHPEMENFPERYYKF